MIKVQFTSNFDSLKNFSTICRMLGVTYRKDPEFFGVNDIESAGLLAGFLGERFYEFWKMVTN